MPGETIDLFPARKGDGSCMMFIHGGYWRSLDKKDFSFLAPAWVGAGVSLAVVNYDLCPRVGDGRDRAPDAAREPLAVAQRRAVRHGSGPALRLRPFGGRPSDRDADVRALAAARPAPAEGPVEGRPRDQWHLRPAAAARGRLPAAGPASRSGARAAPFARVPADRDARAGDDLRRRRRIERVPAAERAAGRALALGLRRRHRHARQEPFLGGRRPRRSVERRCSRVRAS